MMNQNKILGPVNLGNTNEFTILELAEKIIKHTGSKSKIIFNDLPIDDPLQRKPDIKKAVNELKWKATIELDDGVAKTIKYFQEIFNQS